MRRFASLVQRPLASVTQVRAGEVRLRRRVVLGALLLALPVLSLIAVLEQTERSRHRAMQSRIVSTRALALVNELEKTAIDMETGGRGYILTRDESFLEPLRAAVPRQAALIEELRASSPHWTPAETRILSRLTVMMSSFVRDWELPLIEQARTDQDGARARVASGGGKQRMDAIRDLVAEFRRTESAELDRIEAEQVELAARSRVRARTGAAICALLLLAYVSYLFRLFVAPVEKLAAVVRRMGDGDVGARVTTTSSGEVGRLEQAVNEMADRIEASRAELEAQTASLQEQTAELEEQQASLAEVNTSLAEQQALTERYFRFGQRLVTDLDLRRLAERLLTDLAAVARADVGTVHGPDAAAPSAPPVLLGTLGLDGDAVPARVLPGAGPGGRALADHAPVVLAHGTGGMRVPALAGVVLVRHEVHLPLVVLGRPLGVVALGRVRDEAFTRADLQILGNLAEQAAVVVSNAGALAEARRQATIVGATLQANVDGIALFDGDGRTVLLNDSAAAIYTELLGRDARGALGEHGLFVVAEAIAERLTDPEGYLEDLAATGADAGSQVLTAEFTVRDSGRTFRRHAVSVADADGVTLGRLFVMRELTAERQAERLKDELISTVSHELRTPLTSVVGYAEMLEEPGLAAEDVTRFAATIRRQGLRLTSLVDDFLDLQRIESGAARIQPRPVELRPRLIEQAELFGGQSRDHRIELAVAPGADVDVLGDARALDQILGNLLTNAIKYSPAGGVVTVTAARRAGVVRVAVADRGIGIPEAEHASVFRRFFRAEAALEQQIGGTGLGLALVCEMVEAQGGRVGFDSRVGEGSTFWFELPAARSGDSAAGRAA